MIKPYYTLTKPGIIFGNAITAAGGFALASTHMDWRLFFAMLIGLSLIIASACACNNWIDREMDAKMVRTRHRPLVTGSITGKNALLFALLLGILGSLILALFTNLLTLAIALTGFFVYVFLYSPGKYRSVHATLVGSISGGVPPVVGYCAVTNQLDAAAWILFAMIVLWQMPHFFAIAVYRIKDYAAASIPVLPLKKGMTTTKIHSFLYIIAFTVTADLLTVFGYTGMTYLVIITLLGISWLWLCLQGFKSKKAPLWARQMFLFSLVVVTVLCITIPIDRILSSF